MVLLITLHKIFEKIEIKQEHKKQCSA